MKKFITFLMVAMMLVSVTACGGSKETLVGKWETTVAMKEFLYEELEAGMGTEVLDYFEFDKLNVKFTFEFKKDNTYVFEVSDKDAEKFVDDLMDIMMDGLEIMVEDEYGMSLDDLLTFSGMTKDDFVNQMIEGMGGEDALLETIEEAKMEGNYKAEDGKLYLSDGVDKEIDENMYEVYELKGSKLTFKETVGSEADEDMLKALFPLEFKKVK